MKLQASLLTVLLPVFIAHTALAADYPAKNLGSSAYLTWQFDRSVDTSGLDPQGNHPPQRVGYACWTQDTLGGMAKTAYMYRYQIMSVPFIGKPYLVPMQGITIRFQGKKLVSKAVSPELPSFLDDLPRNESGWFESDMSGEAFEKACVGGGIAAGLKQLSANHGKAITPERNLLHKRL